MNVPASWVRASASCAIVFGGLAGWGVLALTAAPNSECLECHIAEVTQSAPGKEPGFTGVRPEPFAASVHGEMSCTDCHSGTAEFPHDTPVPRVQCAECHFDVTGSFGGSIHATAKLPDGGLVSCTSCHGANAHEFLPAKHVDSPVSKFNVLGTCAKCHGDAVDVLKANGHGNGRNTVSDFRDSIHGLGLLKAGLNVAPTCSDCHGAHDIQSSKEATSHTSREQLSATCSACHVGVEKTLSSSVHGIALAQHDPGAPTCVDCHTAHQIERAGGIRFKLAADKTCGQCHEKETRNYHETYHGKAIALNRPGSAPAVAACFDCHGHHDVFKMTDERSALHQDNIVDTCAKCHDGATASFAQYQPHADPWDAEGYPLLNKVIVFMTALLAAVFLFFGVHTLLWVVRMVIAWIRNPAAFRETREASRRDTEFFRRFTPFERFLHMLVVTSFLMLVITGMPLKFYNTEWARMLFNALGGPESASLLHRLAAFVTFGYFAMHLWSVGVRAWRGRASVRDPETGRFQWRRLLGDIFGPDSLVPSLQDFRDLWAHLRWFFGRGPKPQFDRWTYWEKFDYLAVFWGVAMIGVSGMIMWTPVFFTNFLPGWVINIALVIHSDEALLAAGFIFMFHFFNTHFRIDRFPMDMVIFSGRISKTEMMHERRRWYDRLVASGRLDQHRVEKGDWDERRRLYKALGFVFLATGLGLLVLIIYAMLGGAGH